MTERVSTSRAALAATSATIVALAALPGCTSPCDGFNPFEDYERLRLDEELDPVDVTAGKLRLALYDITWAEDVDPSVYETVLADALQEAGGGSVKRISDDEVVRNMLDYTRGTQGPFAEHKVRLSRYEVWFESSEELSSSESYQVEWPGVQEPLKINEEGAAISLVPLRGKRYRLLFTEAASLDVEGRHLAYDEDGALFIKGRLFELQHLDGNSITVEGELDTRVLDLADQPVLLYEIEGFGGDVSELLCQLLHQEQVPEGSDWTVAFEMRETDIWLDSIATKGGVQRTVTVRSEHVHAGASGPASNLTVAIEGLPEFDESDSGDHILQAEFDRVARRATITFEAQIDLETAEDIGDRVVFRYTIDGKDHEASKPLVRGGSE